MKRLWGLTLDCKRGVPVAGSRYNACPFGDSTLGPTTLRRCREPSKHVLVEEMSTGHGNRRVLDSVRKVLFCQFTPSLRPC